MFRLHALREYHTSVRRVEKNQHSRHKRCKILTLRPHVYKSAYMYCWNQILPSLGPSVHGFKLKMSVDFPLCK
jgi:hypothetical protein